MHRQRHLARSAAVLAGTALLAAASAVPSSAAPDPRGAGRDIIPTTDHRYATSWVVLGGGFQNEFGPPIRGNRHQVRLTTDNGVVSGSMRSYYCPAGASVSPTWASSRCVHRQTMTFENFERQKVGRVSSTALSAKQEGLIVGRRGTDRWPIEPDFTLYASGPVTDDGDGTFYSFWREATVSGSLSGRPILSGAKQEGYIGGYGPA